MSAQEAREAREWAATATDDELAATIAARDGSARYLASLTERNYRNAASWRPSALEGASVAREGR